MTPASLDFARDTAVAPSGPFVDVFGGRYGLISQIEQMPPFLMNVVSSSDLWLFLASNGGLTAGRVNSGQALFPYQTVDRLYDSAGVTGPFTAIHCMNAEGRKVLWEPFAPHTPRVHRITRRLYKSIEGDRVWFEEINPFVGLVFRYGWSTAEAFGIVRRCELENLTDHTAPLVLLDGLRNLLPAGIDGRLQSESSCLVDAYKTAELLPGTSLAVFSLAAGIVDRAIPVEVLRASIAWSEGLPAADVLLSERQFGAFCAGEKISGETRSRGIRCAYALSTRIDLAPKSTQTWVIVADTNVAQAEVASRRRALIRGDLTPEVTSATRASAHYLRSLAASADGVQTGGAEIATVHHFANVLFNIMRGGVFVRGHAIPARDFAAFVGVRNHAVAARHATRFDALPEYLPRADFLACLAAGGDRDLDRLGLEYLPLTFSRRHGDPSRPWNRFHIPARDAAGQRVLRYEGNWRDIFQNWEALGLSFPEFLESFIAVFLNASTTDGYNPYRISRDGVDWETPEPDNPWSSIGYWGDHQTVYLLKLLEWSERFHPGLLASWLRRELFSSADVPYRIAPYPAMRANPHCTIEFDVAKDQAIRRRVTEIGTDGRLVHRADGTIYHVNLTEKLLVLILTRLTNFVSGGGIWMNTQRPEWNDANNALVGFGVSVVTLCHLRRLIAHVREKLIPALGAAEVGVSPAVVTLARCVTAAFESRRSILASPHITDPERAALLDDLATAGSQFRAAAYEGAPSTPGTITPAEIERLLGIALAYVDHTLRASQRPDGLYHAYNLLEFADAPPRVTLQRLGPMLEGQVAILSAGLLSPQEVAELLHALRRSSLYRADQQSYLLYPDHAHAGFLERNTIPSDSEASCPLLRELLDAGDTRLILRDADGTDRFHPDLVNGAALDERLRILAAESRWTAAVQRHGPQVKAIYELVFNHREYTGRSGSMFAYEGLGSIYWHMVAKLLVAVQENLVAAWSVADPAARKLGRLYYDVRAGLGYNKTPEVYGAFPTDPYSHTPSHSGAQQPGMTGQVKEEILTRFGELGVKIDRGILGFAPVFLRAEEFSRTDSCFRHFDSTGQEVQLALPPNSLAFTICGVPVIYRLVGLNSRLRVFFAKGDSRAFARPELDATASAQVFNRSGCIVRIEVDLGDEFPTCVG